MTDTAQACGNCKYYHQAAKTFGCCLWDGKSPFWMIEDRNLPELKPTSGKDCPTWHPK